MDKRDFLRLLGSAAVAAPTAVLTARTTAAPPQRSRAVEPAYERVMRTNILRCGYGIWEPGFSRDPLTGTLRGIFHDYLIAVGQHTGLTITFTEEVAWGDYPAALNSGRIDAMCFGAWPKANLAREVLFTEPTYFLPIYAYVRDGNRRFDHDIEQANDGAVTISTMDAELSSELARTRFSKARTLSIPQLSDNSMLLLNVATGKADITFTDAWTGAAFMVKNPGKLRIVQLQRPLRLFGHTIPVAHGEYALVSMLNTATEELMTSGEFDSIVKKYASIPGVLLMARPDYN